jgi:hypothetical protein
MGSNIFLVPTPDSSGELYLWYVPSPSKLVAAAPGAGEIDTMPAFVQPGWDDVIEFGTVVRIHGKQHDAEMMAVFEAKKDKVVKRIVKFAKNRDANRPAEVQLVRRRRRF